MLKTYRDVMYDLREYASPRAKLTQMIKKGEIIRVARGVYADSFDEPRLPVAGMLMSPSYVSFETALSWHSMIPERVYAIKSVGFALTKEKVFDTPFGRYSFHYLPKNLFPSALHLAQQQGYGFRVASAEKAILDTLYKIRSIRSQKAIEALLFEDLRLERERLNTLKWEVMVALAPYYRSSTIEQFIQYREKHEI
jgi:predicted transcriptional regulator of viral defense system